MNKSSVLAQLLEIKTDISWLKKAVIGLYTVIGGTFAAQIVRAYFGN